MSVIETNVNDTNLTDQLVVRYPGLKWGKDDMSGVVQS